MKKIDVCLGLNLRATARALLFSGGTIRRETQIRHFRTPIKCHIITCVFLCGVVSVIVVGWGLGRGVGQLGTYSRAVPPLAKIKHDISAPAFLGSCSATLKV